MREAFDACEQACDKAMMTKTARMAEGIKMAVANSVLIKLQPDWYLVGDLGHPRDVPVSP